MPGSPDIKRAIEIIEQRIQSLQQIKEMLVAEFFGEQEQVALPASSETRPINPPVDRKPWPVVHRTRKQTLIEFLKRNGPTTRGDIRKQTQMPDGTVAFLLADKETFNRLEDGRWILRLK